jgi:predicted aminopeptidase
VKSAWYQADLLARRQKIERVLSRGELDDQQRAALDIVAQAKAFGEKLGFAPTHNYGSVAVGWDRTIWTVSGCDPLAFKPATWWFPIVGRVPYLGYFRASDADRELGRIQARGLDAYKRTAGAYSTLGWFRDPILPEMLTWSEADLAETVLHELAHATVWVKGSVSFNESFASFVGEEASFRYLDDKYGPQSPQALEARTDFEDYQRWRQLERGLYEDLNAVYTDPGLSDDEKAEQKAALFAAFPVRVAQGGLHDPDEWVKAASRGTWNNARLVQFQTYNDNRAAFEALLARHDGDLLAFMLEIREVTRSGGSPYAAVARAARRDTDVAPAGG